MFSRPANTLEMKPCGMSRPLPGAIREKGCEHLTNFRLRGGNFVIFVFTFAKNILILG